MVNMNFQQVLAAAVPVYEVVPPAGTYVAPAAVLRQNFEANSADVNLGPNPAVGDWLAGFLVTPLSTAPGALTVKDGTAGNARVIFAGGVGSVLSLVPFPVWYPNYSKVAGGWIISTGANMRVQAFGNWKV